MENKNSQTDLHAQQTDKKEKKGRSEYPLYPAGNNILNISKKEGNINPENISKTKESSNNGKRSEKDFIEDHSGSDSDVPGSELDDELEKIGSEDEEDYYYSLGGDDYNNLD
jgi:hypothetical protein